jgi:hypothetical protein
VGGVHLLVTRLRAGQPEILGSIFNWGPPTFLSIENWGISLRDWSWQGGRMTCHHSLVFSLRIRGTITPRPLTPSFNPA